MLIEMLVLRYILLILVQINELIAVQAQIYRGRLVRPLSDIQLKLVFTIKHN